MTSDGDDDAPSQAARHATALLAMLGLPAPQTVDADHPALAWRRAGLMTVTGRPAGPGLVAPVGLAAAADGALAALRSLAPAARLPQNGAVLLGERARMLGLRPGGGVSANGSCRLLDTRDGAIALNLPRAEDWDVVPAWLAEEEVCDWPTISAIVRTRDTDALVSRGALLGLAVAASAPSDPSAVPFTIARLRSGRPRTARPLVLDLSSLWAGPLAGSLLQAVGARVIKVESVRRLDGARNGQRGFFDLMNGGKESILLDFADAADVEQLRRLIDVADIVIDSARPRALAALGIDAERVARRGATWLAVTAYGRSAASALRVGFGDDTAVAGGLAEAMAEAWGERMFVGDAIADPLTGITAALAAWASHLAGGGRLVSIALADVAAHACRLRPACGVHAWQRLAEQDRAAPYPSRVPAEVARSAGADTATILAERDGFDRRRRPRRRNLGSERARVMNEAESIGGEGRASHRVPVDPAMRASDPPHQRGQW